MQARSSVHLGNAGEHLVMAHLLAQNFQAFMADRGNPAFDISVVDGHRPPARQTKRRAITKADRGEDYSSRTDMLRLIVGAGIAR